MPRNGSGTYSLPAGNPVVTGTTISSTWANNTLSDISTALTGSIARDGQSPPTANIPMGGFKLTGLAAATANGDALRYQSTSDFTEDTSPDVIADFLAEYDTSATAPRKLRIASLLAAAAPPGQGVLVNGQVVPSVGSNALTVAIKGMDGNDPSASNPVAVVFRSSNVTSGAYSIVKITGALSMTVSSGSTLGHEANRTQRVFVYVINNSGTAELAVSNLPPDYPGVLGDIRLIATTAEGGAGAADSPTTVYSTTARSNMPWACIAMMNSVQTVAGTWAANMQSVDPAPFQLPVNAIHMYAGAPLNLASGVFTKVPYQSYHYDPDGIRDTANYRIKPNVAGLFRVEGAWYLQNGGSNAAIVIAIFRNGAEVTRCQWTDSHPSGSVDVQLCSLEFLVNGTTDYFEAYAYQSTGALQTITQTTNTFFFGHRVPGGGC